MRIINHFTSFQEVPDNLSLCFSVFGCPHKCKNCSWAGEKEFMNLSITDIEEILDKYKDYVSCICFLGGEWEPDFEEILDLCNKKNLLTCLYTGADKFENQEILSKLTFIKVGHYDESLGGLQSKTTNQRFIDLRTYTCLNDKFLKD